MRVYVVKSASLYLAGFTTSFNNPPSPNFRHSLLNAHFFLQHEDALIAASELQGPRIAIVPVEINEGAA